jgi:hypothetical protein
VRRLLAVLALGLPIVIVPATAGAEARSVTEILTIPLAFETTEPCANTGEVISFTGTAQFVLHFTETDSGSILIINIRDTLSGTGDLGTRYQGADHSLFVLAGWIQGADQSISVQNTVIISEESDPNFLAHVIFRFTITPSGDPAGVVESFRFECVPEEEEAI